MNKVRALIHSLGSADKRMKLFLALGALAVLLLFLSGLSDGTQKPQKAEQTDSFAYDYVSALEQDTEALLSSVQGAGRCKVMLTLKNSGERIYAKNSEENTASGSISAKNEYVFYDGQNGEQPVLLKEYIPEVQGVAVVCDGADNPAVRESIINSLSSLFNLPVTKISVSKYKG